MKVSDILRVKGSVLFTVSPQQALATAVSTMVEHDIGSLVVIVGVLVITVLASVIKNMRDKTQGVVAVSHNHYDWDEEGNKIVRNTRGDYLGRAEDLSKEDLPN